MIKLGGVQMGLVDEIINRFEDKSFCLKSLMLFTVECSFVQKHYGDLFAKLSSMVLLTISSMALLLIWFEEVRMLLPLIVKLLNPQTLQHWNYSSKILHTHTVFSNVLKTTKDST